jgi:hypothetical protein
MNTLLLSDLALETDPELPVFFLSRLATLVTRHVASVSPMERAMLGRAVFSVFLDCLDLGLGEQAQEIVGHIRDEPRPVARLVA